MKVPPVIARTALAAILGLALSLSAHAETGGVPSLRDAQDPRLQRGLEQAVRDMGLEREVGSRRLSLALVDVTQDAAPRLAMLNGDELMYAASLPKIAILFGAMVEAERGRLPINETTVGAMTKMIRYSSNEDASRVLGWVGGERLLEILQSDRYRFYEADGKGGLWVGKSYGKDAPYRRDPIGNLSHGATAFQVARLYYLLASNVLLTPRLTELMKETLSSPGIHHKFVKGLEDRPGVRIFRKSGTWRDYHADSALVEFRGYRYILVGLAEHAAGGDWLMRLAAPLHDLVVSPSRTTVARH